MPPWALLECERFFSQLIEVMRSNMADFRRYVFGLFGHLRISAYQRFSISMTPFQMFLVQMDVRIRVNAFLRASQ